MDDEKRLLAGLGTRAFLKRHWQKRALLARAAIDGLEACLDPGRLFDLARQNGVEARLVVERPRGAGWDVRFGPFTRRELAALPRRRSTILVHEVDRHVPAVAELIERFRFVPNWRLDDVMVSWATPGGSVGPHVDEYDVFLLQGKGERHWGIGARPLTAPRLVPDLDLAVLRRFVPARRFTVRTGDLLYLPPRIAHHGIATTECMTFSIGFRAPSHREIAAGFLEWVIESLSPDARYADPDLIPPANPGEISRRSVERVRAVLRGLLAGESVERALGQLVTRPRREAGEPVPRRTPTARALRDALRQGAILRRDAPPRFAHLGSRLFVGGRERPVAPRLVPALRVLCGRPRLDRRSLEPWLDDRRWVALLCQLVAEGWLVIEPGAVRKARGRTRRTSRGGWEAGSPFPARGRRSGRSGARRRAPRGRVVDPDRA